MAETAVSVAIETLGTLLKDKISFLKGVNDQVQNLQSELETMKCFLEDADRKQDEDALIRNWVAQVRDVSIDAEDAIELFITKMESIKRKPSLIRLSCFPNGIYYHNKVGKQIESIQSRIRAIEVNRYKYGIKKLGEGSHERAQELRLLRATTHNAQDKNIVGTDKKVASLASQILKEDPNLCVFSITGMGGIGKTTLARQIFNHSDVQNQFPYRAWICVSERYNFRDMVKGIIKQVELATNEMLDELEVKSDASLQKTLYDLLEGKCYLVVLDDIWQEEGWDVLEKVFPNKGEGGRVLLTSRINSVAQHAGSFIKPYELQTLGDQYSWELFTKIAFVDGKCPSFLEEVGKKIVIECGGLPLAIATIARLLQQKNMLQSEWESVLYDFNGHLSRGKNGVSAILELSYCDLSPELKFCFKYLGLFPENHEISVKKLARLWISEGIAGKGEGSKCLEDHAKNYLQQLMNRNLVQVVRLTLDDKVKSFLLHDLLQDLAIKKGVDENFLHILSNNHLKTSRKPTHFAAHACQYSEYLNPRLRTFLFISKNLPYHSYEWFSFGGIKLIRVLDLENARIFRMPKEISEMSLLRYLGLRGTQIYKLSPSLGQLQRLQFLDVRTGLVVTFPRAMMQLESLLHFDSSEVKFEDDVSDEFEGLKGLRRLSFIHHTQVIKSNLATLTSLEKLGILIKDDVKMDQLCMILSQQLSCLNSLNLHFLNSCQHQQCGQSLVGICELNRLSELKIYGVLTRALPPLPPNLSRLSLHNTDLHDDPMPMLATMTCLSVLKLHKAYDGRGIMIPENGFRQLNFLKLGNLVHLKEISLEKGALPELRCLRIQACNSLEMLPDGFTSLQKLELVNMPKQFIEMLQGPESSKVSRVGTLNIFQQN